MTLNPTVDIVIPVLNEEESLPICVQKLLNHTHLFKQYRWKIIIADNGSEDSTGKISKKLTYLHSNVYYLRIKEKGRGRALKRAWGNSTSEVMIYMDVELSTNLAALIRLIDGIIIEKFDICVGTRLSKKSKVIGRKFIREIMSRGYNFLISCFFPWKGFSDAQCGFKGISKKVGYNILPYIKDNEWFFDTELLLACRHYSIPVKEIAVNWVDDPDTRVKILPTVWKDIKGLIRLRLLGFNKNIDKI